jgi:hypothetical protein
VVIVFLCIYLLFRREIKAILHGQYRAFPRTSLEGI